jgi:hypothetical protein
MSMQETYVPNSTFCDRRFRWLMGLSDHISTATDSHPEVEPYRLGEESRPESLVMEREPALLQTAEGQ